MKRSVALSRPRDTKRPRGQSSRRVYITPSSDRRTDTPDRRTDTPGRRIGIPISDRTIEDGGSGEQSVNFKYSSLKRMLRTDRNTDKQTDRQTDKQTGKQTNKQTDKQTDKQIGQSRTDRRPFKFPSWLKKDYSFSQKMILKLDNGDFEGLELLIRQNHQALVEKRHKFNRNKAGKCEDGAPTGGKVIEGKDLDEIDILFDFSL